MGGLSKFSYEELLKYWKKIIPFISFINVNPIRAVFQKENEGIATIYK
jgi:hypothetical protein